MEVTVPKQLNWMMPLVGFNLNIRHSSLPISWSLLHMSNIDTFYYATIHFATFASMFFQIIKKNRE